MKTLFIVLVVCATGYLTATRSPELVAWIEQRSGTGTAICRETDLAAMQAALDARIDAIARAHETRLATHDEELAYLKQRQRLPESEPVRAPEAATDLPPTTGLAEQGREPTDDGRSGAAEQGRSQFATVRERQRALMELAEEMELRSVGH